MKDSNKVAHLAGLVGDPACSLNDEETRFFNIKTTSILKKMCNEYDIERFIFASSCSVYGDKNQICYEDSSTNPVSLYAQTKLDSEHELLNSVNSEIVYSKIFNYFGLSLRNRFDLVANLFIAQSYFENKINVFGGHQKRPFLHVKDASIQY